MRALWTVLVLVLVGFVGAWAGYFIGFAFGWATDAEFPFKIGAGERAIVLSIVVSMFSVLGAGWLLIGRAMLRDTVLAQRGRAGHATIRRVWRTGFFRSTGEPSGNQHQLAFELVLHPDDGSDVPARGTGMIPDEVEPTLEPGSEVEVRYDPDDPRRVTVVGPLLRPV